MRWERRWNEDGAFINPKKYSPCSLTTVSTHDSETLAEWWENDPKSVSLFCRSNNRPYNPVLGQDDRLFVLRESHKSGSLFHINLLGEYLAIFDDLVYNQKDMERINIPGEVNERNWRLRTRPYLEEIIQHPGLKSAMKALLC